MKIFSKFLIGGRQTERRQQVDTHINWGWEQMDFKVASTPTHSVIM